MNLFPLHENMIPKLKREDDRFRQSKKNNMVWLNKFQELVEYKSKHGDCNVPTKNRPLANWVRNQRFQYKNLTLSEERIEKLNTIGFNWKVQPKDDIWNDKLEQLKLYKVKHGDCNLPKIYEENQPLANWVHTQRSHYKKFKISEERLKKLNAIGFSWIAPSNSNVAWLNKFQELLEYKEKYGDCKVNYIENRSLAKWIYRQRSQYKNLTLSEELIYRQRSQYKNLTLSEERIEKLNDIGFVWSPPSNETTKMRMEKHAVENEIYTQREESEIELNYEQIKTHNQVKFPANETKKGLDVELAVGNEFNIEQEEGEMEQNHEHIANQKSYQVSRIETTNKEKVRAACKRSLQNRIQVLCKCTVCTKKCTIEESRKQSREDFHEVQFCNHNKRLKKLEEEKNQYAKKTEDLRMNLMRLEEEKNQYVKKNDEMRMNVMRLKQDSNNYKVKNEEQSERIMQLEEEKTLLKQKTEVQQKSIEKLKRIQDLSDRLMAELECPICLDPFDNPYMNPECGHRFCYRCIQQAISKSGKECPLCRVKITSKRGLRKDVLIGSITNVVYRDDDECIEIK